MCQYLMQTKPQSKPNCKGSEPQRGNYTVCLSADWWRCPFLLQWIEAQQKDQPTEKQYDLYDGEEVEVWLKIEETKTRNTH